MEQSRIPVFTHDEFLEPYTKDPAAAPGRMECIRKAVADIAEFHEALPASWEDLRRVHTERHLRNVMRQGLDRVASLAAGGAVMAALEGLQKAGFRTGSAARPSRVGGRFLGVLLL